MGRMRVRLGFERGERKKGKAAVLFFICVVVVMIMCHGCWDEYE